MNKEISYSGLDFTTAPDLAPDGSLDAALGLLHVDSALRPIHPPQVALYLEESYRVIYLHHTAAFSNYIISTPNGRLFTLSTTDIDPDSHKPTVDLIPLDNSAYPYHPVNSINSVGNTLVISTDAGLCFYLWKDGKYTNLGERPPFISISFGCYKRGVLTDNISADIPEGANYTRQLITGASSGGGGRRPVTIPNDIDRDTIKAMGQGVMAALLSSVADNVTSMGYFYQPFFVRYAYRLFDGSYFWHSAPVLMLPSVVMPIAKIVSSSESGNILKALFQLDVNYFALAYRIFGDGLDELARWKEVVAGIDIFVSTPVYTYDQSKDPNYITSIAGLLGNGVYNGYSQSPSTGGFTSGRGDADADTGYFMGHYADSIAAEYTDHLFTASNDRVWGFSRNEDFHNDIRSASAGLFYKIASLEIDRIKASNMVHLQLDETDLSSLATRPHLTDEYQSHFHVVPAHILNYNGRLNLAGISLKLPDPFPICSAVEFRGFNYSYTSDEQLATLAAVQIHVWSRHEGKKYLIRQYGNSLYPTFCDIAKYPPRYIYYPDPGAYRMRIFASYADGRTFEMIIPLTPHDHLNGAYWYGGLAVDPKPADNLDPDTDASLSLISTPNKIYTSEVNNPFVFSADNINSVGSGTILGIATAAKALSQGQFGQFPLYAFTTEGVWALEVSATGTYSARQPITRDVCISPEGITQLDSAVLFPTDRGIMLLSGSTSACISDPLNSDYPFSPLESLPHAERIADLARLSPDVLDIIPFSKFLAEARMLYDYSGQRVILYRPSTPYAYVYSLRSKLWGMMLSDIVSSVNSYPRALAIDSAGNLLDYSAKSNPEASTVGDVVSNRIRPSLSRSSASSPMLSSAILITRPLSLDAHDILKTVDTVIQRGHFRPDHVSSILYGSRDLHSWHLVSSSTSARITGFRGTPYKYFRIALIARLSPHESISGCSASFTPRLTNRLR